MKRQNVIYNIFIFTYRSYYLDYNDNGGDLLRYIVYNIRYYFIAAA